MALADRLLPKSEYRDHSERGKALLRYLDNPSAVKSNAVSPWMSYDDLAQWGWSVERDEVDWDHMCKAMPGSEFADPEFFNDGTRTVWTQDKSVMVEGLTYPPTNAIYNNIYYPSKGIILALGNHGPDSSIEEGRASTEPWKDSNGKALPVVKLKQWSDVLFLTWRRLTNAEQRRNLKWVFRRKIINSTTLEIISKVMVMRGVADKVAKVEGTEMFQAPMWPGVTLLPREEGFDALVGSPNGYGLCWLLIQHQEDMGHKSIGSIRVFNEDTKALDYAPTMIMEIVDAKHVVYEGT